ncbi:MAG: hypothetical protein AAF035_10255 [Pseudomonadota bacterium]
MTPDQITLVRDGVSAAVGLVCGVGVALSLFTNGPHSWLFWVALIVGGTGIALISATTLFNVKATEVSADEQDRHVRTTSAARGYWVMVWAFGAAILAAWAGWISLERALIAVPLLAVSVECLSSSLLSQAGHRNGLAHGE